MIEDHSPQPAEPPAKSSGPTAQQLVPFVAKFLAYWALSLVVLGVLALITDINWARPSVQSQMTQIMHRNVQLGRLSWSLGLNGLAIDTKSIIITEPDGKPFLKARDSEIGIAVAPLFQKELQIRHMEFDHPELWAVRVGKDRWNFTDLLEDKTDVRFITCDSGTFHIIDQPAAPAKPAWTRMDLNDVEISLVLPRKNKKTSVHVGFSLPKKAYKSRFEFTGIRQGKSDKWQDAKYDFELETHKLNPLDYETVVQAIAPGTHFDLNGETPPLNLQLAEAARTVVPHPEPGARTVVKLETKNIGDQMVSKSFTKEKQAAPDLHPEFHANPADSKGTGSTTPKSVSVPKRPVAAPRDVQSQLKLELKDSNAKDSLPTAVAIAHPIQGLFDIHLKGKGSLSKGIKGQLKAEVENFSFTGASIGTVGAPHAVAHCKFLIDEKKFSWSEFELTVADLSIASEGEIHDWMTAESRYEAKLRGKLENLKTAAKLFQNQQAIKGLDIAKELSGKANVEVHLIGSKGSQKSVTNLEIEEMLAENLMKNLPPAAKPFADVLTFSKDAKLKGSVKFIPEESIEIKDLQLPLTIGTITANGTIDLVKSATACGFSGTNLKLNELQQQLNKTLHNSKNGSAELPLNLNVTLGGDCDVTGKFSTSGKVTESSGTITLKGAEFGVSDKSLDTEAIRGQISWQNGRVEIKKMSGKIGGGVFELDGNSGPQANSPLELKLHAHNTQLEQLETILRLVKVQMPILTEKQLYGHVKDLVLNVSGTARYPQVYLSSSPDDAYYQPPGLSRPLHAKAGTIVYDKDNLKLTDMALAIKNDKVLLSLDIVNVSKTAALKEVWLKTAGMDLADVNYYLSSVLMPPPLKNAYRDLLSSYGLSTVHGRLGAEMVCRMKGDVPQFDGTTTFSNVGARVSGFPVEHITGGAAAVGDQLLLQNINGTIRQTKFNLDGKVSNYRSPDAQVNVKVAATIEPKELIELLPKLNPDQPRSLRITASSALDFKAGMRGSFADNHVWFALKGDENDELKMSTPMGTFYQPKGERLALNGGAHVTRTGLDLEKVKLAIGNASLAGDGSIKLARLKNDDVDLENSTVDLDLKTEGTTDFYKMISLFQPGISRKDVVGTVDGEVTLKGTFAQPHPSGKVTLQNVTFAPLEMQGMTGSITLQQADSDKRETGKLSITSLRYKSLPIKDLSAELLLADAGDDVSLTFSNGKATVAEGELSFNGNYTLSGHKLVANTSMSRMKSSLLAEQLFQKPGEITGLAEGVITFRTDLDDPKSAVSNLFGEGQIIVRQGNISRFGQLQTKLTQASLLRGGLFGFNLNNLMRSVYPMRSGHFNDLTTKFSINGGVLSFDGLRYNGDDLRLWGSGKANLNVDTLSVEIAGKIPRVASSVIGGPVGEMSRAFTLQKFVNVVTLNQLEALPPLPVLGDFASDKPRTFSFKVDAPMDNPKLLSQSIEKSFHWFVSKPAASAHPVPGLQ